MTTNEHISEARRHLQNAKEILRTKGKKMDGIYTDEKYVKMAGHTAYTGILKALDALYPKRGRKSIDYYELKLAKENKKMLRFFNIAYKELHLAMGYDGTGDYNLVVSAFSYAKQIIDWAAKRLGI